MSDSYYVFPAVRGIQAGKEFYTAMFPLKLIPELFREVNIPLVPPDLRAQRILNKRRIPEIKKYILENPYTYVFSSITISVDGNMEFEPVGEEDYQIGKLKIDKNSRIVINDGQHRIEAIKQALQENPRLAYETISVVVFLDLGLKRSQQIFTDLNRYSVKPTPSISILYDYRDQMAELARYLAENVYYFKGLVEYEKSSISNRSHKLFTLSSIYHATKELLGKKGSKIEISDRERTLSLEFWEKVGSNIPEWEKIKKGELAPYKVRREYIHSHGLFLNAIAIVGRVIITNQLDLQEILSRLRNINWHRSNPDWEGIALNKGRLSKANVSVKATANFILKKILGEEYVLQI